MEIKTKYDIGQEVYIAEQTAENTRVACRECGGAGSLRTITGKEVECRVCLGFGTENSYVYSYVSRGPFAIRMVKIVIRQSITITQTTGGACGEVDKKTLYCFLDGVDFDESEVFSTLGDAEEAAKKLNDEAKERKTLRGCSAGK